jgi:hypothetical protein
MELCHARRRRVEVYRFRLLAPLAGGLCIEKVSDRMPCSTPRHVTGAATKSPAGHEENKHYGSVAAPVSQVIDEHLAGAPTALHRTYFRASSS